MNLNDITGKLTKNANKIGIAYGALAPLHQSRAGIMNNIKMAIKNHDFEGAITWLTDLGNYTEWAPGKKVLDLAIKAGLAGYVIDEFNIPFVKKFGKPLQKAAWGMLVGLPIAMFIIGLGSPASESGNPNLERIFDKSVRQPNAQRDINPFERVIA